VRFRDQPIEIVHVAEDGININVIGDVISEIGHRRPVDGGNPDRIDSEIDEVG
jgi:hypothetical protein